MENEKQKHFINFLNGISTAVKKINDVIQPPEKEQIPEVLTASKLYELRWMTERQIDAIYKHGKVPVKIADDHNAYYQLRFMTEGQLEALFGKQGD